MLLKRFHKWLLSFALIVSVISFNGFTNSTQNIAKTITELVVSKKPDSRYATFYISTKNVTTHAYSEFSFNSFLIHFNLKSESEIKSINKRAQNYLNCLHSKIVYHTYYLYDKEISS